MGHSEGPVCGDDGARAGDEALGARRRRLPIVRQCRLLGICLAMADVSASDIRCSCAVLEF
jgi:hypothetical protein